LLILLGWVLFAFDSLPAGISYLQALFGFGGGGVFDHQTIYYCYTQAILIAGASLASTPLGEKLKQKLQQRSAPLYYAAAALSCLLLLLLSTAYLVDAAYNPFLYFRF
jgi:alginate O-acetyltransferase complex protein AlgI